MRCKQLLLFFLTLLFLSNYSHAQLWSGIISSSRAVNWANAGVPGGIPSGSWAQCGSTIAPYGTSGSPAAPTTINNAIAACTANHYVLLGAGTFYLNSGISWPGTGAGSNVALRGAGANQTFLIFSGGVSCNGLDAVICVAGSNSGSYGPNQTATWTAGYTPGATSITLSTAAGLTAGQSIIVLDQCDDGYTGTGCTTGTATDTGNIWNCSLTGTCSDDSSGEATRTNRSQEQSVLVTGCSPACPNSGSTTVTISPGLYMPNWRSGQNPGAWWSNAAGQLNFAGVENLSIDSTKVPSSVCPQYYGSCGFTLSNVYGGWVTGTRSIFTFRSHVWLNGCYHCTVANNYMYGVQYANSGSYGVENYVGSDSLIVNNIADGVSEPFISTGPDEGVVWADNFSTNNFYNDSSGWLDVGDRLHSSGTAMDLWEGSITQGFQAEDIHGTHNFSTVFRNYYAGQQASCFGQSCYQPTQAGQFYCNSRYFNFIGNVLGTSSYYTDYQSMAPSGTGGNTSIYAIGWSGNGATTASGACAEDTLTPTSLMRWGNYDTVNAAVRFVSDEVPSNFNDTAGSPSPYVNPVPANDDLPASFYWSSQPSFWATTYGTPPWPTIGPDVTGGNISGAGGYANNNPAALVWQNSPVDANYQVSYTIASATWSSGRETLTFSGTPWSASNGCSTVTSPICVPTGEIRISGAVPSALNGTYQVTASTSKTVSFALASNPGTFSSGAMLYPNIRLFTATAYGTSSGSAPAPPAGLTAVVH